MLKHARALSGRGILVARSILVMRGILVAHFGVILFPTQNLQCSYLSC